MRVLVIDLESEGEVGWLAGKESGWLTGLFVGLLFWLVSVEGWGATSVATSSEGSFSMAATSFWSRLRSLRAMGVGNEFKRFGGSGHVVGGDCS